MTRTARLAFASAAFVRQATEPALSDWLAYFEPDAVVIEGSPGPEVHSRLQAIDPSVPVLSPDSTGANGVHCFEGVGVVSASTLEGLPDLDADTIDPGTTTVVVTNALELEIDRARLMTTIDGGDAYRSAVDWTALEGEYVHVSTGLPAGYRNDWQGLGLVGAGRSEADDSLLALDFRTDGRVLEHRRRRETLGLRAIEGVGRKRAGTLRSAGYETVEAVAGAGRARLRDLPGLDRGTADRIHASAGAIASAEIHRRTDEPLPDGDPVYLDIETDGLHPTIVWLIGVLDGSAEEGRYLSFLQRDPDEPGRALFDFMEWYLANAAGRPLVAYNGWDFDFAVFREHLLEYAPQHVEDVEATYRFDPYDWAVREGNAFLPGRTNTLEDVTDALGWEDEGTDLTGAALARDYRRWMDDRRPANEPDWAAARRYNEADCRRLATCLEALAATDRIVAAQSRPDPADGTTQGELSRWDG
ncbi:MAG: ribonuclease H-like domain-containing protein [Halodesulfurarchaeum sp.]